MSMLSTSTRLALLIVEPLSRMSSADVRDILELDKTTQGKADTISRIASKNFGESHRKKSGTESEKRNISRELYSILDHTVTEEDYSIVPSRSNFRAKPQLGATRAQPWEWTSFRNPVRKDQLKLYHWVKSTEKKDDEYRFTKFNKPNDVPEYSDEEYDQLLQSEDWSREETDRLFELCRQFDRRFLVVADRFGGTKTIEDLKSRYYSVVATLLRHRAKPGETQDLQLMLKFYNFDVAKEKERKKRLEFLYTRTPEQIKEEETLFLEYRKLEASAKRRLKDRQDLMRLLGDIDLSLGKSPAAMTGVTLGAPNVGAYLEGIGTTPLKRRRTKKEKAGGVVIHDTMSPITPTTSTASVTSMTENPTLPETTLSELPIKIPSIEESPTGEESSEVKGTMSRRGSLPVGPYLRSTRLLTSHPSIGSRMLKHVEQCLDQLGVNLRPKITISSVVKSFEELRNDIILMLQIKRNLDNLDYDIKVDLERKSSIEKDLTLRGISTQIDPKDLKEAMDSLIIPTPDTLFSTKDELEEDPIIGSMDSTTEVITRKRTSNQFSPVPSNQNFKRTRTE